MKALVTGCAGFIGSALCKRMLLDGWEICGIDNLDPYYSVDLKKHNLEALRSHDNFRFYRYDINSVEDMDTIFSIDTEVVIHLAAKPGVRASIEHAVEYHRVNTLGTLNILELCRKKDIDRMVFASSSSVYGNIESLPLKEKYIPNPISPYGVSKLNAENYCHLYCNLYGIEINILRLFTVYGPGQRPDMAIHKFLARTLNAEPIEIYGDGKSFRDYTYIEDIVTGIILSLKNFNGCQVFNLGTGQKTNLNDVLEIIVSTTGLMPKVRYVPAFRGDVIGTCADITHASEVLGYSPRWRLKEGIAKEWEWLKSIRSLGLI